MKKVDDERADWEDSKSKKERQKERDRWIDDRWVGGLIDEWMDKQTDYNRTDKKNRVEQSRRGEKRKEQNRNRVGIEQNLGEQKR